MQDKDEVPIGRRQGLHLQWLGIATMAPTIAAVVAWLLVVTLDAIQAAPVAGTTDLAAFGPRLCGSGRSLMQGVRGVEVGGKHREHGAGL